MKRRLLVTLSIVIAGALAVAPAVKDKISEITGSGTGIQALSNSSKGPVKDQCEQCHKMEVQFTKKSVHSPFKNWLCTDCHTEHKDGKTPSKLIIDQKKLCLSCHFKRIMEADFISKHKPVANGFCTDCHNPHSSNHEKLLVVPAKELCFSCHKKVYNSMAKVKHDPVEKGNCMDCHLVHGSEADKLLIVDGQMLCFSCHFVKDGITSLPGKHPPVARGDCVKCHEPHANGNKNLLLETTPQLCYKCHPAQKKEQMEPLKHLPFKEEKCLNCHSAHFAENTPLLAKVCQDCHQISRLTNPQSKHPTKCAACHQPHAAKERKLLRGKGNEACLLCHGELIKQFNQTPHSKVKSVSQQGWCTNCHTPHESIQPKLLLKAEDNLCFDCHSAAKEAMAHPVGTKYLRNGQWELLRCVSCHEPHKNQKQFLRLPGNELCVTCHGSMLKP